MKPKAHIQEKLILKKYPIKTPWYHPVSNLNLNLNSIVDDKLIDVAFSQKKKKMSLNVN